MEVHQNTMHLKCGHTNWALEIPVEDISVPLSLRDVCLRKIASNSSYFQLEQVSCLPKEVLADLKWKLSVHDLLLYSPLFEKWGIDTAEVWEWHCVRRYKTRALNKLYFREDYRSSCVDFRSSWSSDIFHETAKVFYLHRHCSDMLFEKFNCSGDCQFEEYLKFYLKHTPSLTVKWSKRYNNDMVLRVIQETVQHLEISLEYSVKDFTELLTFLNSCRRLKSIAFKASGLLCLYLRSVRENTGSNVECIVDCLEAKLDDSDLLFLNGFDCPKIKLRKLDLTFANEEQMYDNQIMVFQSWWFGMTLNYLTHISIDCAERNINIDVLFTSLLDMFKIPSREPLKYLGLMNVHSLSLSLDFDVEKYKGQGLMVEQFQLISSFIFARITFVILWELLKNSLCLSELILTSTLYDSDGYLDTELQEAVIDICKHRKLKALVMTDIENEVSIHSILSHAEDLTFLKFKSLQVSAAVEPDKAIESIASHSNLETLSLHGINLGVHGSKLLELIFLSDCNHKLRNLCLRTCHIKGDDLIEAGQRIKDSACRKKLHVLDISINPITRLQQGVIKKLYHCLTDILILDIPDNPHLEFVAQM